MPRPQEDVHRLYTVPVTSLEHVEHEVTDEECVARSRENRGIFRALCGTSFLPSPIEEAPGRQCFSCDAIIRAAIRRSMMAKSRPSEAASSGFISRLVNHMTRWVRDV